MSKTARRTTTALVLQGVVCVLFLLQFVHLLGVTRASGGAAPGMAAPLVLTVLAGTFLVLSAGAMTAVAVRATRRR